MQKGDLERAQRAAHTIRGASATIGAARLREAAERVERLAAARDLAAARSAQPDVAAAIRLTLSRIGDILG